MMLTEKRGFLALLSPTEYWVNVLGLKKFPVLPGLETPYPSFCAGFSEHDTLLQFIEVQDGKPVDHAKSSGRVAFACSSVQPIFEKVKASGDTVQTPPLTLPTPGKVSKVKMMNYQNFLYGTKPFFQPYVVVISLTCNTTLSTNTHHEHYFQENKNDFSSGVS